MAAEILHAKSLYHIVQKKSKDFFRQFSEVIKKNTAFTDICYVLSYVGHVSTWEMIRMARGVQFASIYQDFLCLSALGSILRKHMGFLESDVGAQQVDRIMVVGKKKEESKTASSFIAGETGRHHQGRADRETESLKASALEAALCHCVRVEIPVMTQAVSARVSVNQSLMVLGKKGDLWSSPHLYGSGSL